MLRNVKINLSVYYGQMDANEQTEIYQGPWPCGFRQEDVFYVSLLLANVNIVTPGQSHFWPQCHNWNRFGRRLLGNAS